MERTIIKNATIISVDPKIGDLHRGDILIEGSKIASVGPSIAATGATVVDGTDRIAIPGFIDTHRHTWEISFAGYRRRLDAGAVFHRRTQGNGWSLHPGRQLRCE